MKIIEIKGQTLRHFEAKHNKKTYSVRVWFEEDEIVDYEIQEQLKGGCFSYDVGPDIESYIIDRIVKTA